MKREAILHVLAAGLLSAYPLSLVLRENLGIVPVPVVAVLVILTGDLILVGASLLALRAVTADLPARAAWLSLFLLLFGLQVAILQQVTALGWPLRPDRPLVAVAYTALCAAIATLVVRPRRRRTRDPIPMLIAGLILFGTNAAIGVWGVFTATQRGAWQTAVAQFVDNATTREVHPPAVARDIYYIVFDGFGGEETLRRLYDLDLTTFVSALTVRGLHVVPHARSNYVQTYLSLASTLNLDYLDGIATTIGRDSANRFPLLRLIDHNALMTLAKRSGYRVVAVGSDYGATEQMSSADECMCEQYGSSTTEQAVLAATPALVHVFGHRFLDAHRRKVSEAFTHLERIRSTGQPVFVFAHVVVPHPPFVFLPDGGRPASISSVWLQDGSAFAGTPSEYRQGYRDQVEFVARRVLATVDVLLERPGPAPVIVLHGDHGPGLKLDLSSADRTDLSERTGILAAYHLPGAARQPHPGMTPVNGARLLSNLYFGTAFPMLEDRTYFSPWGRPYDFLPVPAGTGAAIDRRHTSDVN